LVPATWVNTQVPCTVICDTCHEPNNKARYNDIVNKGSGVCGGRCRKEKISAALKTPDCEARDLMREWHWEPSAGERFPGKGKPWTCTCTDCGSVYPKRLSHVQAGDGGCRNCLGMEIDPIKAAAIMLENDHEPIDSYPGSSQAPWLSWCLQCRAKGRSTITTAYFSRVKHRGHQCWSCRNEKIAEALRYTSPEASALVRKFGYAPLTDYPGKADSPWLCTHLGTESASCGLTVRIRLHSILGGQGGCSACARRGPDYAAPGYLYVIVRGMTGKIGIGGSRVRAANDRLRNHARENWVKVACWSFAVLLEAYTAEQAARSWLRSQGFDWVYEEDMPNGGYTETFSLAEVPAAKIVDFITQYMRRGPEAQGCHIDTSAYV
jgi:hypothetical protein